MSFLWVSSASGVERTVIRFAGEKYTAYDLFRKITFGIYTRFCGTPYETNSLNWNNRSADMLQMKARTKLMHLASLVVY